MKAYEIIQQDDGTYKCGPESEMPEGSPQDMEQDEGMQPVKTLDEALAAAQAYFMGGEEGQGAPTAEQDLAAGYKSGQGQPSGFGAQ